MSDNIPVSLDEHGFFVPQKVLAIGAHCDDIDLCASGTIARWTDAGATATYVIITDSGSGNNAPDADLEQLKIDRRAEQCASAAIVGVHDVRFLDYRDGTLQPTIELRRDLTKIIREIRPDVVVGFDPQTIISFNRTYVNHPDHRAAGEAMLFAVFPSAGSRPIFPELLADGYEPHEVPKLFLMLSNTPSHWVDITSTVDKKMDALRCHITQFDDTTIDKFMKRDRNFGQRMSVEYAEGFMIIEPNS